MKSPLKSPFFEGKDGEEKQGEKEGEAGRGESVPRLFGGVWGEDAEGGGGGGHGTGLQASFSHTGKKKKSLGTSKIISGSCLKTGQHSIFGIIRKIKN